MPLSRNHLKIPIYLLAIVSQVLDSSQKEQDFLEDKQNTQIN